MNYCETGFLLLFTIKTAKGLDYYTSLVEKFTMARQVK